ncbi:MAG: DinB family protein [Leptospiraceae bacterium]|nr:DinB family protein [Leptospiraceae bacterium]
MINVILLGHGRLTEYGAKLIADLSEEQMIAEPAPNMNHPAWVFSHLNAYLPIFQQLMKGEAFDDPKEHPFGMQSSPQSDRSIYPSKSEILETYTEGNKAAAELLKSLGVEALQKPVQLERWKTTMPDSGSALGYLMLAHHGTHLGQISAWRRALGLPSV